MDTSCVEQSDAPSTLHMYWEEPDQRNTDNSTNCKIRQICLHGGRSRYNRTIVRLSTNQEGSISSLDTLLRLLNFEYERRVAPHLAPNCRNVPDNPALHRPLRLRPYQVSSHHLDEIQPGDSDREHFISATDVLMYKDSEKLRQAQQAGFGPYFEYIS